MTPCAIDLHRIAASIRNGFFNRAIGIECCTALVERDESEIGAERDIAFIGCQHARQQINQGGFASAIWPHNAQPIAAHQAQRKVAHNGAFAERFANALGENDLAA